MARIFITGSIEGLGRAAAEALLDQGHEIVFHARSHERAAAVADLAGRAAGVVIGDLSEAAQVRAVAAQVNAIGRMDAVIHNAGVYTRPERGSTAEGHAVTFAVNTLAPYMLTALIECPGRLVYLSSGLHRGGAGSLDDLDWTQRRWDGAQAYAESKLHNVALALAVARRWPDVLSNAVDPGWVRTRMGGSGAPRDLDAGQRTQSWLAASVDEEALTSGGYWHDRRQQTPNPEATDPAFGDAMLERLATFAGEELQ